MGMIPPLMIPVLYKAGVAAVIAFVIAFTAYYKGYNNANDKFIAYRTQVETIAAQNEAEHERKLKETDKIIADTASGWAAAVDSLRHRPAIRVQSNCNTGTGITMPTSPGGVNEASIERLLSSAECETVANNAIQDAAHVLHLQSFIIKQHEATR
jgi:hypothetical protein